MFDLERDDIEGYVDAIVAFEPQLIGISLFVWSSKCLIEVSRRIRKRLPNCAIVFGGPSARPAVLNVEPSRHAVNYIDAFVTRDGEQAICDIARLFRIAQPRSTFTRPCRLFLVWNFRLHWVGNTQVYVQSF